MREIKFRAWHDGKASFQYEPKMIYDDNPGDCLVWKNQRQPLTIMQYTGLKDKNGVEIFEGDIVRQVFHAERGSVHDGTDMTFDGHHIGTVVTIASKGVCMRNPLCYSDDTGDTERSKQYKSVAGYRCEVIGNIYTHPHLLGSEKE